MYSFSGNLPSKVETFTVSVSSLVLSLCFGVSISNALTHPQLERRHEQMKRNLEAQYKELEEKRRVFEDEKANWEAQQRILEQQKLDASKSVTLTSLNRKSTGKICVTTIVEHHFQHIQAHQEQTYLLSRRHFSPYPR